MVRTQIYLTPEERAGLSALAQSSGKNQSLLIREAVDNLIRQFSDARRNTILKEAAGLWQVRTDLPDFTETRKSWDRT